MWSVTVLKINIQCLFKLVLFFSQNTDSKNLEEVVITEITPEGTFYAQSYQQGPDAERLNTNLRQEFDSNPPIPGAYKPKKGDICAAKFTSDNEWYRAKVEKIQGNNASVLYIDYGNREVSNSLN